MEVFIEGVFIDNLILDYFLLLGVKKILHINKTNLLAAALFGAFYAVAMPLFAILQSFVIKLTVAYLMVVIGFKPHTVKSSLIYLFAYLITVLIAGGCVFALEYLTNSELFFDGVFYSSGFVFRSAVFAVLGIALVVTVFEGIIKAHRIKSCEAEIKITTEIGSVTLKAVIDSGNSLSARGLPVAIVEKSAVWEVLSPEMFENAKMAVIPYKALGKNGILFGFVPQMVQVTANEHTYCCSCIIALCEESLCCAGQALIQPTMIDRGGVELDAVKEAV